LRKISERDSEGARMKKKLFFVDAETDGLYGTFLSIAVIVTDYEGNELERHYWGMNLENIEVQSGWTRQNVIPIMGTYEVCQDEDELLDKFWHVWKNHQEEAYAIADVCYPVESTLFQKCVLKDKEKRAMEGPFPLLDLSSILLAKGMDPLIERMKLVEMKGKKMHNALTDVEISISIWRKIWLK
jgi:hypothetical protein